MQGLSADFATQFPLISIGREFIEKYDDQRERQTEYTKWFRQNRSQLRPLDRYKYIDSGGVFTGSQSVHNPGKEGYRYDIAHPITGQPCKQPFMGYRFPRDTMQQLLEEDRILFGEDHDKIVEIKLYASEYKSKLPSVIELDTRLGSYALKELFPEERRIFDFPKPPELIQEVLSFATDEESIVLDSFAGSGTTAQAVLALNQEDGGNRRFVLIECEDYADTITAERVRRVIKGVPSAKDDALKTGYGGSFSYFELGSAMRRESILDGSKLPTYEKLAAYIFFTATGEEFDPTAINRKTGFIGSSRLHDVFLIYTDDVEKLKDLALTLPEAQAWPAGERQKLVFAPTKYVDPDFLRRRRIAFQQLPFEIYESVERLAP
ncbi:MAG: site-specific DNA-methyltransferase [Gammaproteobacteria bacterium]|nr:site-specific DNA-methyltransferase [Gammaproteobacteria bacterium]